MGDLNEIYGMLGFVWKVFLNTRCDYNVYKIKHPLPCENNHYFSLLLTNSK